MSSRMRTRVITPLPSHCPAQTPRSSLCVCVCVCVCLMLMSARHRNSSPMSLDHPSTHLSRPSITPLPHPIAHGHAIIYRCGICLREFSPCCQRCLGRVVPQLDSLRMHVRMQTTNLGLALIRVYFSITKYIYKIYFGELNV